MPHAATTHRLGCPPFLLERISRVEERVSDEIPQSHVVTIPEQLLEFRVDFLYGEHSRLIRRRAGHGPPPARLWAGEPEARPPHLSRQPQTAIAARRRCPANWVWFLPAQASPSPDHPQGPSQFGRRPQLPPPLRHRL